MAREVGMTRKNRRYWPIVPRKPGYRRHQPTRKVIGASFPWRYAARMTTVSKYVAIVLVLSAVVLAQSTAKKNQTNPQTSASAPAASGNGKGQKDAAAKASGHPSNMSGNHKDMMMSVAADKNQGSTPHSGNMVGNHKDVMMSAAPAPAASGKTQPAASPAAAPTGSPAPVPDKSAPSNPHPQR